MPLISVVIPLYNKDLIIKETLDSVLNQSFTDYEVIIVNDGSTDNSKKIVTTFSDNRIFLFNQSNKGAASARNLGIEKANGELIAFLDADDYWFPNHLEELVKLYYRFPNCGSYCSRYKIQNTKENFKNPYFKEISDNFYGIIPNYFRSNYPFKINITLNQVIPKKILLEIGGFSKEITNGQDLELWTKIAIKYPIALHNKTTAIYNYYVPNSLSKKDIKQMKLMNFNQFRSEEIKNKDLKKFLDLHRIFYAIHYKMAKENKLVNFYLGDVKRSNIPLKTKILFLLPSFLLRKLLKLKHWLRNKGVDFTIYN
ncbi:glycosyltransferase family 2 protein [Flavobacterium sp. 316]|uniref:glycosyltransferase family 2 protein n=1 Tax=Flavobacterium sp. 316 TaxID=1603293 RepID=UPI000695AEF4|nr:glycosyltransferase family 2 protein [Flavobacterium sp. 316]